MRHANWMMSTLGLGLFCGCSADMGTDTDSLEAALVTGEHSRVVVDGGVDIDEMAPTQRSPTTEPEPTPGDEREAEDDPTRGIDAGTGRESDEDARDGESDESEDARDEFEDIGDGEFDSPVDVRPVAQFDVRKNASLARAFAQQSVPSGLKVAINESKGKGLVYAPAGGGGGNPGDKAPTKGKLKEVDLVHLGGESANKPPIVVTASGTGGVGMLSSFKSASTAVAPVHLKNSPQQAGHEHKLHVLGTSKTEYGILLSTRINGDNLWLTTWRVHANGTFELLDTLGYGSNANFVVARYGVEHRMLPSADEDRFQVVTPVLRDDGRLRMVTWEVNGDTGQLSAKQHSPNSPTFGSTTTDISVSLNAGTELTAPHFVVAMQSDAGRLNHTLWNVANNGVPALLSDRSSGSDIRNNNPVSALVDDTVTSSLNQTGHVTATVRNGDVRLYVWEDSTCLDESCVFQPLNISDSNRDLQPMVPGVQQGLAAIPTPVTQNVFLRDPVADEDMFVSNPDTVQAIASVRKVMVTIVALDAVRDGEVSLDDEVTVSAAAANVNNTGASVMGLAPGEKISLRDLLYGNMMISAGDATWAISEHVAGDLDNMVTRMNNKANAVGMSNTFHCQRGSTFSSVSYSTARDQTTLWETAYEDELFLELSGRGQRDVCGTLGGQDMCHPIGQNAAPPMTNGSMNNYPNMAAYKSGGGGGKCQDLQQYATTPTCPNGGCLLVQANRIDRPLILAEFQPENAVANRWTDMRALYDFGFREIFTPDFLGDSGATAGTATDFAIATVSDLHALSVTTKDSTNLELCNWAVDLQAGSVDKAQCTTLPLSLSASPRELLATPLDMVRLSTLFADGDYLVGHLDNQDLQLSLWRVGQRD